VNCALVCPDAAIIVYRTGKKKSKVQVAASPAEVKPVGTQ
jgi:hypothetical protein